MASQNGETTKGATSLREPVYSNTSKRLPIKEKTHRRSMTEQNYKVTGNKIIQITNPVKNREGSTQKWKKVGKGSHETRWRIRKWRHLGRRTTNTWVSTVIQKWWTAWPWTVRRHFANFTDFICEMEATVTTRLTSGWQGVKKLSQVKTQELMT